MGVLNNISIFRPRPIWARFDTTPFLLLQGINLLTALSWCFVASDLSTVKDLHPWWMPCRPPLICMVALPILIAAQVLVHLGTYWSVHFRTLVTMYPVKDVASARYVKVQPRKLTEQAGICQLERITLIDMEGFQCEVGIKIHDFLQR